MKRYVFQATADGLARPEKGLERAFVKWLKSQGLLIASADVIEMAEPPKRAGVK